MPYYPPQPGRDPRGRDTRGGKLLKRTVLGLSLLLIGYGSVRLGLYAYDYFSARQTTRELRAAVEALAGGEGTDPDEKRTALTEKDNQTTEEAALGTDSACLVPKETGLPGKEAAPSETEPPLSAKAKDGSSTAAGRLPPVEYPHGLTVVPKIRELRKKSEYILGWITMEGLEEPVVRKDNAFFLNHDAMGKRNGSGAIFMDEKTSLLTRPYTIFLYGHNMKTGAMFGGLRKYEDFSYYFRHRLFQFDTLYEEGQYVIFAVETIQITPGRSRYLDLYALESTDREIRRSALERLKRLSMHEAMLDVNEEDQLVLLITCVGDEEERLVVAARRLREGEQPDRLMARNG
ncbi:MAG: class B sortase [Clostridia bacterium]|nr:class B sortase [Clostridia bacterium]